MSSLSPQLGPLAERMKRLLSTGDHADVHFLVGQDGGEQELLPAHKLILRLVSDVFDAMFRFDEDSTEVSNSGHVRIPDVDTEAFKTMLDFIYTDNLSGVNGKNTIDVLYAAKKYNLPVLVKACVHIPISELDNVFIAFAKAQLLEEKDFADRCLSYIDRNADTLIKSDGFLQIDQQLLCELLGRDQLVDIEEIAIWKAALRWADEQCRQNDLDNSPENRRQMLGSALYQIRFPLIRQKEFSDNIVSSGLLTSAELVAVFKYHSSGNSSNCDAVSVSYPLPFSIRQRSAELSLKIEKFSEFSQADLLFRKYSKDVNIGGFKWKIYAEIKTDSGIKYLGMFIQCKAEKKESDWSCSCSATLRIVSQKKGKADFTKTFDHTFNSKTPRWGDSHFSCFVQLMNPNNGWFTKLEDRVILSADVTVKE